MFLDVSRGRGLPVPCWGPLWHSDRSQIALSDTLRVRPPVETCLTDIIMAPSRGAVLGYDNYVVHTLDRAAPFS